MNQDTIFLTAIKRRVGSNILSLQFTNWRIFLLHKGGIDKFNKTAALQIWNSILLSRKEY